MPFIFKQNQKIGSPIVGFYFLKKSSTVTNSAMFSPTSPASNPISGDTVRIFISNADYATYLREKLILNAIKFEEEATGVFFTKLLGITKDDERRQQQQIEFNYLQQATSFKLAIQDTAKLIRIIDNYMSGLSYLNDELHDWLTGYAASAKFGSYNKLEEDIQFVNFYSIAYTTPPFNIPLENLAERRQTLELWVAEKKEIYRARFTTCDITRNFLMPFVQQHGFEHTIYSQAVNTLKADTACNYGDTTLYGTILQLIRRYLVDDKVQVTKELQDLEKLVQLLLTFKPKVCCENALGLAPIHLAAVNKELFEKLLPYKTNLPRYHNLTRDDALQKLNLVIGARSALSTNPEVNEKFRYLIEVLKVQLPSLIAESSNSETTTSAPSPYYGGPS